MKRKSPPRRIWIAVTTLGICLCASLLMGQNCGLSSGMKSIGEACTRSGECESLLCRGGICVENADAMPDAMPDATDTGDD